MIKGSVGTVKTLTYHHPFPLLLESGETLPSLSLAYETYGRLNREKNNAILVCHALSGDAHVAGFHEGADKPGWWDTVIGPASTNPETGRPYGAKFPVITIRDMVNAQKILVDHLKIGQLYAVVGGSMGGSPRQRIPRHSRSRSTRSGGRPSFPIPAGTTATTTGRRCRRTASRSPGWLVISPTSRTSREVRQGAAGEGPDRL